MAIYLNTIKVKELIREEGTTQDELASRLGISPAQMSSIVNGNKEVSHEQLEILLSELDTSPSEIIGTPSQEIRQAEPIIQNFFGTVHLHIYQDTNPTNRLKVHEGS